MHLPYMLLDCTKACNANWPLQLSPVFVLQWCTCECQCESRCKWMKKCWPLLAKTMHAMSYHQVTTIPAPLPSTCTTHTVSPDPSNENALDPTNTCPYLQPAGHMAVDNSSQTLTHLLSAELNSLCTLDVGCPYYTANTHLVPHPTHPGVTIAYCQNRWLSKDYLFDHDHNAVSAQMQVNQPVLLLTW